MNIDELCSLLGERRISKLYVEIYKKPTGFNTIEEMREHIQQYNNQIEQIKICGTIPNLQEILDRDEISFEKSAINYFIMHYPFLKKWIKTNL